MNQQLDLAGASTPPEDEEEQEQPKEQKKTGINWRRVVSLLAPMAVGTAVGAVAGNAGKGLLAGSRVSEGLGRGFREADQRAREDAATDQANRRRAGDRTLGLISRLENPDAATPLLVQAEELGVGMEAGALVNDRRMTAQKKTELERQRKEREAEEERLRRQGRANAVTEEAARLRGRGNQVTVTTPDDPRLDPYISEVLQDASDDERRLIETGMSKLLAIKDYPRAAQMARRLGMDELADGLEQERGGPDDRVLAAVTANPKLFRQIPPGTRADLIGPLHEAGFDFSKVLENPPQGRSSADIGLAIRLMDLGEVGTISEGLQAVDEYRGQAGEGGGGEGGGDLAAAESYLRTLDPEEQAVEIEKSLSDGLLTDDQAETLRERLGLQPSPKRNPPKPEPEEDSFLSRIGKATGVAGQAQGGLGRFGLRSLTAPAAPSSTAVVR